MKKYLHEIFKPLQDKLNYLNGQTLLFTVPNQSTNGDYSTNIAMTAAKTAGKNPRQVASEILENLEYDKTIIEKIEIAGPGFLNFYFTPAYAAQIIKTISAKGNEFGRSGKYKGKKALVEFVSANPTGPLTVGHGRNSVIGDTLANMLSAAGYDVQREYYFNNAGRQMRVLGDSVKQRYLQLLGKDISFPEDYYQGEYITDIARKLLEEKGNGFADEDPEGIFKAIAEQEIFADIKNTLSRLGINFDTYFNENSLYEEGNVKGLLEKFKNDGLSYEKDGAVWLKLAEMGNEQDKVIVKSTGEPTYRLPDIAYHINKFERGYDLMVDLFGSDHMATYPDVMAALKVMGYDIDKVKVIIHQFVTIMDNGQIVKMSTRKANFITLDELIDEAGADVVRYFFIMRSVSSHLNFDIKLAKTQSDENPVFYLQYAHARICSILRMTGEQGLKESEENLHLLTTPEEYALIKKLHEYEEEILYSAENYECHRIAGYLEELAALFHKFYTQCRIIGSAKEVAEARISLAKAVRTVLRNGLGILGLSAPEKM